MQTIHQTKDAIALELQVIEKAKADSGYFAPLYEKYYKQIFLFIYRRTDDEDLTADLTSQVFLKALVNLSKYVYKGVPFSAWLYRIAGNEINLHFRNAPHKRCVNIEDAGLERLKNEIEETDEREEQILESFQELSEEEILYLELRFFENKPFKEVAYICKVTENNAKVKTYRILEKIKKIISVKSNH